MSRSMRWMALALALALGACGGGDDPAGHAAHDDQSGSATTSGGAQGDGEHDEHGEDTPPAFAEPEATTRADVTLRDYAFLGLPARVKGPNVLFAATVTGSNEHELDVVDASGKSVGVIHPFEAGSTKTLAVVLQPGTYAVQCLVKEGTKTHAELGMKAPLTVE